MERPADTPDARVDWVGRCEGFRVDSPDGRYGAVEAVMFRVRPDLPDALVVRAGTIGRRRLVLVPIEDVETVMPRRSRITLSRVPAESGVDFVTQVRARLRRLAAESGTAPRLRAIPQVDLG